jgi:hypothetical protein
LFSIALDFAGSIPVRAFPLNSFYVDSAFSGLTFFLRERNQGNQIAAALSEGDAMPKYGKTAGSKVKRAMHKKKKGTLKSGRSGKKVTSKKQAIAIGLSEARKKGAKVPKKRTSKKK